MTASRHLFVNLCVDDLDRAVRFFTGLGFAFDPRFTDETATCMVLSEQAYVMLITPERFAGFTRRRIADPGTATEAIMAVSATSRDEVDRLADAALASGGTAAVDPLDHGFMYSRSFHDPDGHMWEVVWMDMDAAAEAMGFAEGDAAGSGRS